MSFRSTETMIFDGVRVQRCTQKKALSCFLWLRQLSWCRSEVLAMGIWSCSSGEIQVYWPWNLGNKWSACKRCRTRSSHPLDGRKEMSRSAINAGICPCHPSRKRQSQKKHLVQQKVQISSTQANLSRLDDLIWWSQRPRFSGVSQTAQLQPKITCTLNLSGCDASAISNVCPLHLRCLSPSLFLCVLCKLDRLQLLQSEWFQLLHLRWSSELG